MTKPDHSTTLPGNNRHQICELAEEWRHELDLAGPFADDATMAAILGQVPGCCAQDAAIVRGWIDGRKGYRDASHAHDSYYMAGFWSAVGRNLIERHGPEKKAPASSAAAAFFRLEN